MESEHIFPKIELFSPIERIKKIANFLFRTPEVNLYMSEHYRGRDAEGEALQPELPFDYLSGYAEIADSLRG